MKKLVWLVILIPILVAACSSNLIILEDGKSLPANICSRLDNQIIVVHETGCPWCAKSIPILQGIEKEMNTSFMYLDVADKGNLSYMLSKGFTTQKIPALIYKCNIYMGAKTKEEYEGILNNA